jgi:tight adherence protein B
MIARHSLRCAVVFLGAAFAGQLLALPAHAADEVTIDHVESASGVVSMVVSLDGLPDGGAGASSVAVQIDGEAVDSESKTVSAGDVERSTILVVDASNSMRGAKFAAATDAVTAFLASAPPDVKVGMVAFAGKVGTSLPPTEDRTSLLDSFKALELAQGTGVYDAVAEAVELAGTEGSRSLLLLSDGADTGSNATLEEVAQAAVDNEVVIDVVSLASAAKADALATLAADTSGRVIPADPEALGQVFAEQADALANQLLVTFEVPDGVSGDADISVSVDSGGSTYSDSAFVTLAERESSAAGTESVVVGKPLVGKTAMLGGLLAVFLGLVGVLAVVIGGAGGRSSAERRLDDYFGAAPTASGGARRAATPESSAFKGSAVAMTEKVVNADLETRILRRLSGAGSALTAAEWLLLHAGIAVGSAFIGFLLAGAGIGILCFFLGIVLPWLYLKFKHSRRLRSFNGQLAQTLGLMAGGLQAGLSLPQAVDAVVREGHEPMAGELRRALVEQRLGVDISDALENVGDRMESDDFGWVVMAIRIQREVGGNLAEIFHTVADTLREREYLRRQVRALSAEGRLSGYILSAMPPGLFVYMIFANNDYVRVLYTTTLGYILLAAALLLLGIGGLFMSKLAKVEV